jgi:hypothetical protein
VTASLSRTVTVVVAALAVAATLVLAASTGPADVVGARSPDTSSSDTLGQRPPPPDGDAAEEVPEESITSDRSTGLGTWTRDVLAFALLAAGLWVLAVVMRALIVRLARHLPEEQLVLDLDPLPDLEGAREAVRADQGRHEEALSRLDVRNGIVACWVLLEEAAAGCGVSRRPAETATEFVVRFLHQLDVDPRPVAALADLFHEARFSTHHLGEEARGRATAALDAIHRELERSPAR